MGFLSILRDSAKIHGDSQGFSGFPQKTHEVSEVSSPSVGGISAIFMLLVSMLVDFFTLSSLANI